jgi:hypothetical protein
VADKSEQLILNALTRAAASGSPLPWHGSKPAGLFASSSAGKQAAQRCRDECWLTTVPVGRSIEDNPAGGTAVKTKAGAERCTLTEKGLSYLFGQVSPRQVLEEIIHELRSQSEQLSQMTTQVRKVDAGLDSFRSRAESVLEMVRTRHSEAVAGLANGQPAVMNSLFQQFFEIEKTTKPPQTTSPKEAEAAVMACLAKWNTPNATEDCPLPELYRQANAAIAAWSIGQFHDLLRRLQETNRIYLHPWTGPLYEMPQPPFALLVGHEVAYYASVRN